MLLFTIGYESLSIDLFLARLKETGINIVVDIRELPLSRKKGFSKNALSARLDEIGIRYIHQKELGCPRYIRDGYKIDRDWTRYRMQFEEYILGKKDLLSVVSSMTECYKICLVCYELDFRKCHRSMVASAIKLIGFQSIIHLTPTAEISG